MKAQKVSHVNKISIAKMVQLENSAAGQGVFTISCPEACGKHCHSSIVRGKNTSISVVIVSLSHVNKNSVAEDGLARIF